MSKEFVTFMNDRNKSDKGYIYVITDGQNNYKVGSTKDIENRISYMQTGNAFELKLYAQWLLYDYENAEKILHEFLSDKRIRGEWFKLEEKDIHEMCICLYQHNVKGVNFEWQEYFDYLKSEDYE